MEYIKKAKIISNSMFPENSKQNFKKWNMKIKKEGWL